MKKSQVSRRGFLQTTGASTIALMAANLSSPRSVFAATSRTMAFPGNKWPGRSVFNFNEGAVVAGQVQASVVKQMVDDCIMNLTGEATVAAAWEAIFPASNPISTSKRIAIKVNNTFTTKTHWQVVQAVTDGLVSMLSGTFPAANISIYDLGTGSWSAYSTTRFPGVVVGPSGASHADASAGRNIADCVYNADYLINIPVLKTHWESVGSVTLGFKNHIGSHNPVGCPGNSADLVNNRCGGMIKDKTVFTLLDATKGTKGGYDGSEQTFTTYASSLRSSGSSQTDPCTIIMSTDPVAVDYLGRKIFRIDMNDATYGSGSNDLIAAAENADYGVGTETDQRWDFREFINGVLTTSLDSEKMALAGGLRLEQNSPNPVSRNTDIAFSVPSELAQYKPRICIYDLAGQMVWRSGVANGRSTVSWNGCGFNGRIVPNGTYVYRIVAGSASVARKLIVRR